VKLSVYDTGLNTLANYARNGREAVNMIQIAAGLAITDDRNYIKDEEIEWVIHSSQLSPRMERKIHTNSKIGLVNGLAVFGPNSGALLEIEVSAIPAKEKGSINITGIVDEESIGTQGKSIRRKSMARGSIENVITVLDKVFNIGCEKYDIHVNFPGGSPVDGPSAGISITTAIYSALTGIPVDNEVAMTGEISLYGNVKPIGGVNAKIAAAVKAGAKKIIIPKENWQDSFAVIEDAKIIAVSHINEVLDIALVKEESINATVTIDGSGTILSAKSLN
jgi:Lon-like ATP-dependent protease